MKGFILLVSEDKKLSPKDTIVASCTGGRFVPRTKSTDRSYGAVVADLMSARPGDKVFFFIKRGLYGVCSIAQHSDYPLVGAWSDKNDAIGLHLEPSETLFSKPLDMDDVLMRPGNEIADGVRLMGGKSFFQLDPDESSWLEEQFYRRRDDTSAIDLKGGSKSLHEKVDSGALRPLSFHDGQFAARTPKSPSKPFATENFLHAALIEHLQSTANSRPEALAKDAQIVSLHHEYPASPAKQALYVDEIDVVRTWGRQMTQGRTIPMFYECWELKKDLLSSASFESAVRQAMKYVDYVTQSKMNGDFGRVAMRICAHGFPPVEECRALLRELGVRRYQVGMRELSSDQQWKDISLVTYSWTSVGLQLQQLDTHATE